MAKYDKDYDLRDRARFMRAFVFPPPGHEDNPIIKHAKKIFLAPKPAPVTESRYIITLLMLGMCNRPKLIRYTLQKKNCISTLLLF